MLRRIFNVARRQWKWKIGNPVSDIELPKVRNERVRYLEPEEDERLMKALPRAAESWLRPLVLLALDTGLRLGNILGLQWSDVKLRDRMIVIAAEKMKNEDYIGIPLTERAMDILKELQKTPCLSGHVFHDQGEALYAVKVQRAFRRVLKDSRIVNFRFHDLRHTFASRLRQRGIDLHTIGTLLGHKDMRMTKRYAHLNVQSLREAIGTLSHVLVTVEGSTPAKVAVTN